MTTKGAVGAVSGTAFNQVDEVGASVFSMLMSTRFGEFLRRFRRVEPRAKYPRETGSGAGASWVAEGVAAPLQSTVFDAMEQANGKIMVIDASSRESWQFTATSEQAHTVSLSGAIEKFGVQQLLDPAITSSASRPGSLTSNAQSITSSGSTASAIASDIGNMVEAANTPLQGAFLAMQHRTYFHGAAAAAAVGLTVSESNFFGLPVLLTSASPRQVTLIDPASIAVSFDDTAEIDVATRGDLVMDSAPTASGITGSGQQMVSLFQAHLIAVRIVFNCWWQSTAFNLGSPAQTAGVVYMSTSY
jgi:hypothetical protein